MQIVWIPQRRRTTRRPPQWTPVERCSRRHARGQSLVELALVLPILFLLIFGGIGVLQVLLTHYTVEQAARAAAHQAAIDGDWSLEARTIAGVVLDGAPWTRGGMRQISGTCAGACRRYSAITVTVSYHDRLWVPLPFFGDVRATATAVRAAEQDGGTPAPPSAPGSGTPSPGDVPGPIPPAQYARPLGAPVPCPTTRGCS
jgi:TadE-like protein